MRKQAPEVQSREFNNFKALTKNLLAVPKKEADDKKAEYDKQREHEKGKRTK